MQVLILEYSFNWASHNLKPNDSLNQHPCPPRLVFLILLVLLILHILHILLIIHILIRTRF